MTITAATAMSTVDANLMGVGVQVPDKGGGGGGRPRGAIGGE